METGDWLTIISIIVGAFIALLVYLLQKRDKETKEEEPTHGRELSERFLTSSPRAANSNDVIGRNKDLKKLWAMLSDKEHVMLTGFGGIGKTRLAQLLFHEHKNEFDEVAWIDYQGNLKKSLLACIIAKQFDIENKTEDELWKLMKRTLNNDGKKRLFVVDNVDSDKGQHPEKDTGLQQLISLNNTTVLLTSRMKALDDFHTFELGYLSKKDCIALFNLYYQGKNADSDLIASIVELAGMHTLTIEILAKGARQEDLKNYYKKVKRGFDKVDKKVTTKGDKKEDTIERHLQCLFNLKRRRQREKKVLHGFAVLPVNCECTEEELIDWFGFKKSYWTALLQDGWLNYDSNNNTYSLHPLLRTIVRFGFKGNNAICPSGVAKKMLKYLEKDDEWFDISNSYKSLQRVAGIVLSVMDAMIQKESKQFATIYHKLGFLYKNLSNYDKALEYNSKALAIREKVLSAKHPDTATSYDETGVVYWRQGNYDKALEYFFKALLIREKSLGTEHPDTASSYNNIAGGYWKQGNYDKALEFLFKALAIREKKFGMEHKDTATSYNNIGLLCCEKGNYGKSLEYYFKTIVVYEKILKTNHSWTATTYNNIGLVYYKQGDYGKALEYHEKALAIWEKNRGTEHPLTATSYDNIGTVYDGRGDYRKALEYLFKALTIREKVLGTEHPKTATSYNNIGMVYDGRGDYGKALEYYFKALAIREKVFGTEHPDTATTYNNIGVVYDEQGDYDKALEFYFKALAIREKILGTEHPDTATTYNNIGLVYYERKEYKTALEYLGKALEIRRTKLGDENSNTQKTLGLIDATKADMEKLEPKE